MGNLRHRIADLSPEKRALLTLRLRKKREADACRDVITRRQDQRAYPISFAQERLWFLNQMEPESSSYNVPAAVSLSGPLNVRALEMSLNAVVERHEVLRASFPSVEGRPQQVVSPDIHLPLPVTDLSALSPDQWTSHIRRAALEEGRRPFDLSTPPLVRAQLLRLVPEENVLLLTLHHIVFDGWSTDVFLRELSHFYEAYSQDRPPELPELPIQYADYAHWQREWLSEERLNNQIDYWTRHLGTDFSCINLPSDRTRASVQSHRGARRRFKLAGDLYRRLSLLGKENDATTFMTLLAAFQVLLFRYTSRVDIRVGTPVANRTRSEVEDLIGFFVNTLVMNTDFSGDPTFREILHRVRKVALDGYSHQDVPFERLVEELNPVRDMSYTPLFQVMFDLRKAPLRGLRLGDLQASLLELDDASAKFDLNLTITEEESEVWAEFQYSTDLFERDTIERMGVHFERLLEEMSSNPDRSVSTLPMLAPEERLKIVQDWNNTGAPFNRDATIQQLFDARVEDCADHPALWFEGQELSYRDLQKRANRLAHHLVKLGVKEDTLVGLCLERSLDLVVGVLAILKAGGAYVPLDPAYPDQRLVHILDDSGASILITRSELLPTRAMEQVRAVLLDRDGEAIAQELDSAPDCATLAENLAYVIYTSGSTGKPKGVMISHRAALNLSGGLEAKVYAGNAGRPLRATLNAPLPFDASVQQLVLLLRGDMLYIPKEETRRDPEAFLSYIRENKIDVLDCVPSLLRLLIGTGFLDESEWVPSIVLPGGEAIDGETWKAMRETERTRFYNMYGPTECAVDSTICLATDSAEPSIGGPIINARCYVLDEQLQPLPVGVPGELHIAGEGLGRGYYGRPDLTAEKFIPEPFSGVSGARMYRTGDLVRFKANGALEFLGRIDNQVKVRGFRIELGEIEEALRQHETVKDAVLIAREDTPGNKRLVGYVVPVKSREADVSVLRAFLKKQLPDYMVPSAFVVLEEFPLTPNGKVDRKALPPPDEKAERETVMLPQSPVEELLAGIISETLGVGTVGRNENFFDLGGHSLLAAQVMSRIRQAFEVEIPLRAIFELPTVAELGAQVKEALSDGRGVVAPPIMRVPAAEEVPLSFAQQRLWFMNHLEPGSPLYNMAGAVRLKGRLLPDLLDRCFTEIVRRHESLRTVFPEEHGKPVQAVLPPSPFTMERADLRPLMYDEPVAEAMRLVAEHARQGFDLARGPLLRGVLVQIGDDDHIAGFAMHHIVSDGWSTGVLYRELVSLYAAFLADEKPALGGLPLQYRDYAVWQRSWMSGEVLEGQLGYWKDRLKNLPPLLELPTDKRRPAQQTSSGAQIEFHLSPDLTGGLTSLSRREGVTLFMTLLGGLSVLLKRYTGQEDISIGTPVANRNRAEIEGLIGFFVNTLVMRTDLSGDPTVRSVLQRVREVAMGAYAHQEVPFEKVVDVVQTHRDLSATPLFQVMFALQNAPAWRLELPGMEVQPMEVDLGVALFDLTFTVTEESEGLRCQIAYNTDLFEVATVRRLAGHYENVLTAMVVEPERRVSNLPLLLESERRDLVERWNDTTADYPRGQCIHHLFESQVDARPEAEAVAFEERAMTYAELDRRANQLARYLQGKGVGPESLVGISLERSPEMIIAILGVLKSGAGYVPLDPTYPQDRLIYIVSHAGVSLVITQDHLAERLSATGATLLRIDAEEATIAQEEETRPDSSVCSKNLAYVLYTSGSTGRPKGVGVQHEGVCNLVTESSLFFRAGPGKRVLQFSSLNFDASVMEIFTAITSGSTLVLARGDSLKQGEEMLQLIREGGVTACLLPPSLLAVLPQDPLPGLEAIMTGGERVSADVANRWGPGRDFVNLYGPTEATVVVSRFQVRKRVEEDPPIGRPIRNTRLYLLDTNLEPVPVGVAGELYISGLGLARGYLHRPDLTAEEFMPDPFSGNEGERMYRTGDLARFLQDGNIDFLGRIDTQVKLRGYRIELGEIESTLVEHPSIMDAAVLLREDVPGERRIVAYVVPVNGEMQSTADLRTHLLQRLPEYMIPAAFVTLERMPLTPNDKIDRRALPPPGDERPDLESEYVAPRNQAEEALVEIVEKVLGIKQVGVHDNFFELGGDSILGIQVIARANEAGFRLNPKHLFQYPTIADLANASASGLEISAEQGDVTGTAPLTPIQRWFFENDFPELHHWNQSVLLEVHERIDRKRMQEVVDHILRHHDALRMRYRRTERGWEQENSGSDAKAGAEIVWLDLSRLSDSAKRKAIMEEGSALQRSLDLEKGSLVRVAYFDMGDGESGRLLIIVHHLVIDGVSWRILLEDIHTAYRQLTRGEEIRLPAKTTSFKEWTHRLREYADSDILKAEVQQWRRLSRARWKQSPLPVDATSGPDTEESARWLTTSLSETDTKKLLREVPQTLGADTAVVLLTALVRSFSRWTGKKSLMVDLESYGRDLVMQNVDISRTVGWFTAMFPVLLDLGASGDTLDHIAQVKAGAERMSSRGVTFGLLRYLTSGPETRQRLAHMPQPDVSFNYLGQFDQTTPGNTMFSLARESAGAESGGNNRRTHLLGVTGRVVEKKLEVSWNYSANRHEQRTVERLAEGYLEELRGMLRYAESISGGGTARKSDSDLELSQREMENLLAELQGGGNS